MYKCGACEVRYCGGGAGRLLPTPVAQRLLVVHDNRLLRHCGFQCKPSYRHAITITSCYQPASASMGATERAVPIAFDLHSHKAGATYLEAKQTACKC
ncbi:hypothetical protein NHX12_032110 [Muraenolepis orangiensis]|uniref:Uncharacterized protein n=1 Tax=Muraenolepis orangiensis TaxID=630683 RepID=A0A9Q0IHY0_9TELE|nr:hypothetical protein NHX12_032110 [Muraenolepis orangiensis]